MKRQFRMKHTLAMLVALLCVLPCGCKSTVPNEADFSKAYADLATPATSMAVDFDNITVGSSAFSVWASRARLDTVLGDSLARVCGTEIIGGTDDGTYCFLGSDCSYSGILRERFQASGTVLLSKQIGTGTILSDLLTTVPQLTTHPTDVSGNTRYSILVANGYIVIPDSYSEYLTAIRSGMLFPNCTFSLSRLTQELSAVSTERQKLYATARMALLSDISNHQLDRLLEISFVVNTKGSIVSIEYTLYHEATSLLYR